MANYHSLNEMQVALRESQQSLLAILNRADDDTLYRHPAEDEWSLAENLVHLSEARAFFTGETRKVLAQPGATMGRTIADPHRIQNVQDHGHDSRDVIEGKLTASYEQLVLLLQQMSDDDLRITGQHVKFGEQTLGEFMDHFIVEHDEGHVKQSSALLP